MSRPPMKLSEHSADYAALSELAYRRDPVDPLNTSNYSVITHIDNVQGISAYNPLESESLLLMAKDQPVTDYVQDQYGLTIDAEDRGDGITHFYTDNGLSAFVSVRENDPNTSADDEIIVTFRGTDVANDADGEMMDGLKPILQEMSGSAGRDMVNRNWARNNHPSKEEFRRAITERTESLTDDATTDPDNPRQTKDNTNEFTVTRNSDGEILSRFVDPGDWYTNILLGQGTYQETQYDDAKALMEFIKDHVATDGQEIISNGQSLGGGLAALVGVEYNLETHTFGMAPFQNQFEVIAQRNAIRDMILEGKEGTGLSALRETYLSSTIPQRNALERKIANEITDLSTTSGGHSGLQASNAIAAFNNKNGTHLDRNGIREFRGSSQQYQSQYEANKENLTAITVRNEFTTNAGDGSWLGYTVSLGSTQIIPTEDLYMIDLGADQTEHRINELKDAANYGNWINNPLNSIQGGVRGIGEGLAAHSPALNGLLVATENSDRAFSDVFQDNQQFRYSVFHRPGLAGGVTGGKVGPDNDPSATQSDMPSSETTYRALANSVSGDGELYQYTHDFFTQVNDSGRAAQGANALSPADSNLSSGVNQIALQALRESTSGLRPGESLSGQQAQFAGDYENNGYAEFNLAKLIPSQNANADVDLTVPKDDRIALQGKSRIHGYSEIQDAIYQNVRENLIRPSDTGFFDSENRKIAELADDITGAELEFLKLGFVEGRLNIPDDALDVDLLYVQTGQDTGYDIDLDNEQSRQLAQKGEGVAAFMGDGDNVVRSSDAKDHGLLGDGNDTFIATLKGGDLVVGDRGYDTYAVGQGVGPIIATIGENVSRVSTQSDYLLLPKDVLADSQDQLVSMEEIQGSISTDIYNLESLAGAKVIDGMGGGDYVNYTKLNADFKLFTDDITIDGTTYSARLTDGENTFYFLNIPDENISNIRTITPEDLRQNLSIPQNKTSSIEPEIKDEALDEITLVNAVKTLAADQTILEARFSETGISSPAHAAVNHPDATTMLSNLHNNGVTTLKAKISEDMGPEDRVGELLTSAETATREAGIPMPEDVAQTEAALEPTQTNPIAARPQPVYEEEYDSASIA